ncbi:hypothetical protein CBS101457_003581 [Exobasidium rhododendri]|nr:hypothetical protein CBS101457_003581 [Exobasidium rhododendri]
MSSQSAVSTMGEAGVIAIPDQRLHLLPLLQSESRETAPLDRLPHVPSPGRIAFTSLDSQGNTINWTTTTHAFPSAYPRSHFATTSPPSAPQPQIDGSILHQDREGEREARKDDFALWDDFSRLYSAESFYPPSSEEEAQRVVENLAGSGQPQLWSCVQRIVPSTPVQGGITLFLAHANGFHKEIYEPTVQSIINSLAKQGKGAPVISEVWSLDAHNSGDSAALNIGKLGRTVSWFDHPRDMIQFLDFYLPEEGGSIPTLLEVHAQGTTRKDRTMIGIGHSFSGAGMVMLNSTLPDYFQGLIAVDPVGTPIEQFKDQPFPSDQPLSRGAVARKDTFTNRRSAEEYLKSKPYFQAWDKRVVDLHLRFGFRPLTGHEKESDPPVTLCMSKWSEALAFSTSFLGSASFEEIKRSKYKGWSHLICTSEGAVWGKGGPGALQETFSKYMSATGRSSTEVMKGGHLIVQEQPDVLGARLAEVISHYTQEREDGKKAKL